MLRVAFFGMEIRILDELRHCHVHLIGACLPPAPYWIRKRLPFLSRFPWLTKRCFKTITAYGHLSDFLENADITALKSDNVNSLKFRKILKRLNPDLCIVSNFGQILGKELIDIPKYGFINLHPSLLPRYRGPNPLGHILLNGEKISGITWHQMTTKIDQGDILAQETFPVELHYTLKDLETKSITLAIKTMGTLLEDIEKKLVHPNPQNEADATYFHRLTKKEKKQLETMGLGK